MFACDYARKRKSWKLIVTRFTKFIKTDSRKLYYFLAIQIFSEKINTTTTWKSVKLKHSGQKIGDCEKYQGVQRPAKNSRDPRTNGATCDLIYIVSKIRKHILIWNVKYIE